MRTVAIFADSWRSNSQDRTSMETSSRRNGLRSCPRKRLPTTSRFSHSARSWNTVAMPRLMAAAGSAMWTSRPANAIVPASGA